VNGKYAPYSFVMMSRSAHRPVVRRAALVVLVGVSAIALVYLLLWYGPDLLARHDVAGLRPAQRATQFPAAIDNARGRLLTLGAGLVALSALIYTARSFTLSREGQVTDRYTKAIEQLGSDKLDVRIGGIYALERIARDSSRDHSTVMEVLAAFIREHSHEPWQPPRPAGWHRGPELGPRPDILAAIAVIGRRDVARDRDRIDLSGADLSRAQLPDANLARCGLNYSNLTGANLFRANLRQTEFVGADLTRANLNGSDLYNANFTFAILAEALLSGANLGRAIFSGAKLTGLSLREVDLTDVQAGPTELGDMPIPDGWERDPDTWRLRRSKT
jgi:hypothetical protein